MNTRQSFLDGMAWIALFLGVMSLLAVLAFHFPEYLQVANSQYDGISLHRAVLQRMACMLAFCG